MRRRGATPRSGPGPRAGGRAPGSAAGRRRGAGGSGRAGPGRGLEPGAGAGTWLFIERSRVNEPVVVELDRPMAYRPRVVGFWRGTDFHLVTWLAATRREHAATYYRVLTDRGAFEIRNIRRMDPHTLRIRRAWELCAELDTMPVARLP